MSSSFLRQAAVLAVLLCAGLPPAPCAAASGLRVAVIADLNGEYGSAEYGAPVRAAVKAIVSEKPGLVLIAGDMVAGGKASVSDGQVEKMWAGFDAAVAGPLAAAGIPLAPTPGNHDASAYGGNERDRRLYERHWPAAEAQLRFVDAARYPFEYAFSAGGALFIALDQTTLKKLTADRLAWLDGVLKANAGFKAKIVFTHVPLFPFTQGRETEVTGDYELEALLARHGVALVVTGHHHGYYPGRRGAVRYTGAGCLGGGPRKLIGTAKTSAQSFLWLTIGEDGAVAVEGAPYPDFSAGIARESLPPSLGDGGAKYIRDDLAR